MRLCFLFAALLMVNFVFSQDFPGKFTGHWEGELHWYKTGQKQPQTVKMQLMVQPADTAGHYTWQLIYGSKSEDSRPYILKPVDTARGHWVIDERNGIVLDQYWTGNRFSGAFTVQGSTIINSYWLEGDQLMIEFFSISAQPINKSGGASEEIPAVESYAIKSFQKAVLRRVAGLKN